MKKLDYVFIACFGAMIMSFTSKVTSYTPIIILVGAVAVVACYRAVKEDAESIEEEK